MALEQPMVEPLSPRRIPCWDLLGRRRHEWSNREGGRDIFGFLVEENVPIFLNAFTGGDLVLVRVDYPHGLHFGAQSRVQYIPPYGQDGDDADDTAYLCDVCTVRAVKHFAYQWLRHAKRKVLGRLLTRLSLPESVYPAILSYAV